MEPRAILTIGHSDRSTDELLALLVQHGVEVLVDVRRYPGSRRHPHFRRAALAASLRERGIDYLHRPDLGGHRQPREDDAGPDNRGLGQDAFRGYADHMATPAFRAAARALVEAARERRTVVLCAEADPGHCHRRLLADWLTAAGEQVLHVRDRATTAPHALDARARRLAGGGVHYPPDGGQLTLFGRPG